MAKISPPYDKLKNINPRPTTGESTLLKYFDSNLDDSYEVYFQPSLNGDKPDIILMRENSGVMIIEVKDWNLEYYYCDEKGNFILRKNNLIIKSPFDQVKQYKDNLYNLHSEVLLERNIFDNSFYALVKCAVYFHNATVAEVKRFLSNCDKKVKENINRYYIIIGSDSLNKNSLNHILNKAYLNKHSYRFDNDIYQELNRNFKPSIQEYENLDPINFSQQQKNLTVSKDERKKIKGVAGSGKTLVLAQRAVNAYIRTEGKILILTYNITLKNYIHDNISRVRGKYNWENFDINNYHKFITFQMNNVGIIFESNENSNEQDEDELDMKYFSNLQLFERYKSITQKYDSIFIDEVQDYKYEWLKMIEKYFLKKDGEFVIFGDEKQNIYKRKLERDKTMRSNITGRWNLLNKSYRLSTTMTQLAVDFQKKYLALDYTIDNFDIDGIQTSIIDELNYHEQIYYNSFDPEDISKAIYTRMKKLNIHSNDVCIASPSINYLREIDESIKNIQNEDTTIMFETKSEYEEIERKLNKNNYKTEEKRKIELNAKINSIRQSRKFNFWMNGGLIKLSTIHSFKGWEINTLILIVDNTKNSTNELIYTGLTRCKENIIIINIGNLDYKDFFSTKISTNNSWDK